MKPQLGVKVKKYLSCHHLGVYTFVISEPSVFHITVIPNFVQKIAEKRFSTRDMYSGVTNHHCPLTRPKIGAFSKGEGGIAGGGPLRFHVKLDHLPRDRGKHKKYLKPPSDDCYPSYFP